MATNAEAYESYGCEIMEIASRCIQNFDSDKGVFLHYFNSVWKQEYKHICGDEAIEKVLHGLRITEEEKRSVRRFLKFLAQADPASSMPECYRFISEAMQITVPEVEAIAEMASIQVTDEMLANGDGEETSAFDVYSDGKLVEDDLIQTDKLTEILNRIEVYYNNLHERQKPILADLITAKLCEFLFDRQIPFNQYAFINAEILETYSASCMVPSQRDIAMKFNRNEASISRTMREFLLRLENLQ
jgi:hypothetical protein